MLEKLIFLSKRMVECNLTSSAAIFLPYFAYLISFKDNF